MCVFTLFDDETNERVIVLLYVDDIIITSNSLSIVPCIIGCIESNITKISNLGEITRYIGMDLLRIRVNHTLELTKVPYTKSVIAKLVLISRRLMSLRNLIMITARESKCGRGAQHFYFLFHTDTTIPIL
jgi:hypothetical protein